MYRFVRGDVIICFHAVTLQLNVRCIYLYIIVSLYVRGLPAYLHLYLYYIL
jgi:hypothetical protein